MTTPTPIVALDVSSDAEALALVDELGDRCRFYKIGNELFTACGPSIVRAVIDRGCDVFLDLKFHDIPNTVAGGVRRAASLGARLVTVHATGGRSMLEAAVNAAGDRCGVLAVTVLTSLSAPEIASVWGRSQSLDVADEVLRLSDLAHAAGTHGVVCSGREAPLVRDRFGGRLATLVPGVRAAGAAAQDQARVVTPIEAAASGARYIVVGRMVTAASDRRAAMSSVLAELAAP
ncbi:MAG TPA: orotidine-5'-phosphate decarboxylase [Gemmatimonadaceae bacterium]